ncbi:FtsB family cell division protein [Clostridium rectalis]|uniref:FtsB family cell division protein n=1 Tax=Clostridium rectalis TaxID=2040295 RepID=UPI0019D15692|nr:septum formation initiator family protein [Clostridium rectalis]
MKKIKFKSLFLIMVVFYIGYIFVNQQFTIKNIKTQINEKNIELQKLQDKNQKLQDEVNMSKDDSYIERLARERLKLVKPNEIPVVNSK